MKLPVILWLVLAVVMAGGVIIWNSTPERNADRIIAAIEDYRERAGPLPDSRDHGLMKRPGFALRVGWHPD